MACDEDHVHVPLSVSTDAGDNEPLLTAELPLDPRRASAPGEVSRTEALERDGRRAGGHRPSIPQDRVLAPRFARAAEAERSRLEGERDQLLRKREAVQAELGEIDRAVRAVGELLELLAPLLAADGGEAGAARDDSGAEAERGAAAWERGEADGGDPTPALIGRDARTTGRSAPTRSAVPRTNDDQLKEQSR